MPTHARAAGGGGQLAPVLGLVLFEPGLTDMDYNGSHPLRYPDPQQRND